MSELPPRDRGTSGEGQATLRGVWRRRFARCVTVGGSFICAATFLPWVVARYGSGWWSWNGMNLTYAHWPPMTIGYLSLALGGAAVWMGLTDARRPGHSEIGIIPAAVMALFLAFINASFHGHMGQWVSSYRGFSAAWLGPGYWVMVFATALVFTGSVGTALSGVSSPDGLNEAALERTPEPLGRADDEVTTDAVLRSATRSGRL